jgi:hypothetical protein
VIDSVTEADDICKIAIETCYFDTIRVVEMAAGIIIGTNA